MSSSEFDHYLALIGKLLQLTRQQQESIGLELRDHLESRVADLLELGMERGEAIRQALEEFGDAALMAKNLQFVSHIKRRRWMMRFATFSIAGSFLVAILAMAMWPDNARFGGPDRSVAQVDKQDPALSVNSRYVPPGSTPVTEDDPFVAASLNDDSTNGRDKTVSELNELIEQKLKETVSIDYQEVDWRSIQADLSDRNQINIITDQSALEDQLNFEESLTIKLNDLPLEVCLKHLLKLKNATFVVKDGAILVVSADCQHDPKFLTLRSFDCRELIQKLDLQRSSKTFENALGHSSGHMGGEGGLRGPGGFGNSDGKETPGGGVSASSLSSGGEGSSTASSGGLPAHALNASSTVPGSSSAGQAKGDSTRHRVAGSSVDLLTNLVIHMTDNVENWDGVGYVKVVNGILIVRHSRDTLAEVEVFLDILRRSLQP